MQASPAIGIANRRGKGASDRLLARLDRHGAVALDAVQDIAELVIPAGASLSNGVDLGGARIQKIIMPLAWSGGQIISFQMSTDGAAWSDLHHAELGPVGFFPFEVTAKVPPGSAVTMPPGTGAGIGWMRVRSGTRTTPVVQAEDRLFQLVLAADAAAVPAGWW